ncbi:MAG: pyridoxal phosphate-dependent aminotransferase [Chloroflexi bacterium]|nr:pyridoxal phosphate-dependent aminotransferase [Chloroflexota bacterium]
MSISNLAKSIQASPTLGLNDKAKELRSRGEPVINLGVGEPKNHAPMSAIMASTTKLNSGQMKYVPTSGLPSLKKAIIRYTEENYGRLVSPENVIVSTGAKQSLFNIILSVANPKDEVILLTPYWVTYPEIIKLARAIPVIVDLKGSTFHPRLEDIEKAVSSKTSAIIVNSPNNPSGVVYSEEFIAELVDFCEKKEIYLITDDIYHKLVFDGVQAVPALRYTKKDIENTRVITVNGVSKIYGLTGYRIGWAISNKRMVEVMSNIQVQTTSCASAVSQAGAEGALTGSQTIVENLRLNIQNNREVIMNELSTFSDINVIKPDGTFYVLPDFSAYNKNSLELSSFLLEKALVVCVPGVSFGMEGFLRISFSGSIKGLIEGVERMKWALDSNSPAEIYIGDRKLVRNW